MYFKMTSLFQVLSLVLAIGYTSAAVGKLPPTFDKCAKGPNFDACAEKAIEKALAVLEKGYPPLGIFSVDPLEITAINIAQGSGPVSINLQYRDLKINGFKDTKVTNYKSNFDTLKFSANTYFPKLILNGLYKISGKVLILPITGDGQSKQTLYNVTGGFDITGKHFKKDGRTYMKISNFDFHFDTKKIVLHFTNLFNGDKALGDHMNRFLNENSADILKELKPSIQETFGFAFAEIANRIFTKVPFDDIFLKA